MVAMVSAFPQLMPGGLHFDVLRVFQEDDFVAVECDGRAVTARGEPYDNKYCFTFRMQDGLIAEIHEYFCSKLAEEVIAPMVHGA
jgi:ketosteroid isomerase-like protein